MKSRRRESNDRLEDAWRDVRWGAAEADAGGGEPVVPASINSPSQRVLWLLPPPAANHAGSSVLLLLSASGETATLRFGILFSSASFGSCSRVDLELLQLRAERQLRRRIGEGAPHLGTPRSAPTGVAVNLGEDVLGEEVLRCQLEIGHLRLEGLPEAM